MHHRDIKTWSALRAGGMAAASLLFSTAAVAVEPIVVLGDPADYEAQSTHFEGSAPTVGAQQGDAEELRVLARDTEGQFLEQLRPIFQFDLSGLAEPPESATLNLELLFAEADRSFPVELWGSDSNRDGPLEAGDSGSGGEFASSAYEPILDPGTSIADETTPLGEISADITAYLDARFQEYALSGGEDSWVYFRLQPEAGFSPGDGVDAALTFASADHADSDLRPSLDYQPVPEPRTVVLGFGLAALSLTLFARWPLRKRPERIPA